MVIGKPTAAGMIPVILGDDEQVPRNLNDSKVVIFRQGNSTGRQLKLVKPLGELLGEDSPLLRPPPRPVCNYSLDPEVPGGPMHQHDDGSWWFFESTWNFEQGPYASFDDCLEGLTKYCIDYQNSLTPSEKPDTVGVDGEDTKTDEPS